ncbi:uncharacterized [Tachysurus ichikawai]
MGGPISRLGLIKLSVELEPETCQDRSNVSVLSSTTLHLSPSGSLFFPLRHSIRHARLICCPGRNPDAISDKRAPSDT